MQPIPYFGERIRSGWIYEPKIDGWRMQIICYKGGKLECWGRRLERKPNWSDKLNYLLEKLHGKIPENTVLDCELCSSGGRRFIPSLLARKHKVKPIVFIFDMIYYNGMDISKSTLKQRKEMLSAMNFDPPFCRILGNELTDLKRNYMSEVKKGHEGIIIKKLSSPYRLGKESPIATQDWRKIK
jgi:bifunctional non-homologous end joining protein LigD